MSYKDLIKEELKKTNLKDNSIKLYTIRLNNIYNDLKGVNNSNDHLTNTKKVMNYINKLNSLDTQLATFNAIIKIIPDGDLKDFYINERSIINHEKFTKYKNNVKTKDFIEYKTLLDISPEPDFTKDIKTVLYDFLLYISIRYPIRLSLWNLKVITNKKNINLDENYLYVAGKKMTILMNDFKNIKSMKNQEIEIEEIDKPVIKEYLKYLKRHLKAQGLNIEYLLYNFYNQEIIKISSREIYSRILSRLLKKKLEKDLTMNDLRKSYETHIIQDEGYNKLTNKEKDKLHNKILHTHQSAILYYNKV